MKQGQERTKGYILSHFKNQDPLVFGVLRNVDIDTWMSPLHTKRDYFLRLTRSIIGQQLSTKAASTIIGRFYELFPRKRVTPERILELTDAEMRAVGMSWAKARYVKDLSQKTVDREIHYKKLKDMSDKQVIEELTKVKGIGLWTAEMFLMFSLGRSDIFSHGDAGLRRGIVKLYGLRKPPSEATARRITNKWKPFRSYGSIALWESLES